MLRKEAASLLWKLEARKGCTVGASSIKRSLSMSHFDIELWKLESLISCDQSRGKKELEEWMDTGF